MQVFVSLLLKWQKPEIVRTPKLQKDTRTKTLDPNFKR